jgi:hypothetical protein
MNTIKLALAFWFALSSSQLTLAAENTPPAKSLTPMEFAARIYNNMDSPERLYNFLKIGASESDKKFIEQLQAKSAGHRVIKARAKGDQLWFDGLEKPLRAVNLKNGEFEYDGRIVKFDWSKGFRANYDRLNGAIRPKQIALIDWILPQAEADLDWGMILSGALTGGGLGMMIASPSSNMKMLGGIGAMLGVFGLLASYNNHQNYRQPAPGIMPMPQSVSCMPTSPGGIPQVMLNGASGPYATVSPYPNPYTITPNYGYPYGQAAAGQLYGMCNDPGYLNGVNYALAPSYPAAPSFASFYRNYGTPMSVQNRGPAAVQGPTYYYPGSDYGDLETAR